MALRVKTWKKQQRVIRVLVVDQGLKVARVIRASVGPRVGTDSTVNRVKTQGTGRKGLRVGWDTMVKKASRAGRVNKACEASLEMMGPLV
jgi:hypothetical protein